MEKAAVKVGVLTILALGVFARSWLWLSHINPDSYTIRVTFDDTKGVAKKSGVRMQGVVIGEVQDVKLDTSKSPFQPVVTIAILREYNIPKGSHFRVGSGLLITNAQVEVVPSTQQDFLAKDNSVKLSGDEAGGALSNISPELDQMVKKLNKNFDNLSGRVDTAFVKINGILDQSQELLKTTNAAAKTGQKLISDPELQNSLKNTTKNFEKASEQVAITSKTLSKRLDNVMASGEISLNKLLHRRPVTLR